MSVFVLAALVALPPLMPVSDVQPGQTGECRTVFEGDAVEPFPFTVKGVMKNFLGPGRDVVLVRLEGDKARFTGVVAGMSGSPCSIGGKLVGALAYSFGTFTKEPIAGITPMDSMLDVMELPAENRPWRIGAKRATDWAAFKNGEPVVVEEDAHGPRPIATPLAMGGVMPIVRRHFEPWLRSIGFEPMAGGSGNSGAEPKRLEPGSAIAAVLVSGDVDIAATGTVTSVEGDTVLAFGHPFFGAGAISLPMANATIMNTLASEMRSFKMSTTGAIVGEVTQDRLTAIGGHVGKFARMVPVQGRIRTANGDAPFRIGIARDIGLTPRFLAIGASSALAGRVDAGNRGTVRMKGRIEADGIEPIQVANVYSAERDDNLFIYSAVDVAQVFDMLWDTPFGPPPNMRVTIDTTYEAEPVQEWVEAIHVDRPVARAGDSLEVAVRLGRLHGTESLERFVIKVPRAWVNEEIEIVATGVDGAEGLERRVAGDPIPDDLKEIGDWLSKRRADGHLYLMAVKKGVGLRSGVQMHSFVPPSVVATMSGEPNNERRSQGLAWEERRIRPGTVVGAASTSLKVRSRLWRQ